MVEESNENDRDEMQNLKSEVKAHREEEQDQSLSSSVLFFYSLNVYSTISSGTPINMRRGTVVERNRQT